MASNPRIAPSLPPAPTPQALTAMQDHDVPITEYMVGRPTPKPVYGLAALFGGSTRGPRSTTPFQPHPTRAITGSGTGIYGGHEVDVFVEGGHAWGPLEGDPGFPSGTRWPGYPTDWDVPYFSAPAEKSNRLTQRISVVWSCIDLISRLVSTMPTTIARDSIPQPSPAWLDNPEPLLYSSIIDAFKALINCLLIRGEAFVLPSAYFADGYPARWFCLNPDVIIHDSQADGTTRFWLDVDGDPDHRIFLDPEELLHIRYQVAAGDSHGIGPLEASWRNINSAESMANYASQMSGRGGVPNAVLQSESSLTQDQARALKMSWRQMIASNGAEPVVLTRGLTYTPLSFSARDLSLLDSRVFDEQRIASAFGVPPFLVGLPAADSMTYTSSNMAFDYFWRSTLRPLSKNIGLAFSLKMLPAKTYLVFDSDELTRPGQVERATAYQMLIGSKVLAPDEARVEEGWAPLGESERARLFPAPPQFAPSQPATEPGVQNG